MTCSFSKEFSAVGVTEVENEFIFDYLPVSSGDAVRVYLYGLFLCKNPRFDRSLNEIADSLKMTAEEVADCFGYWEELGLVDIISEEPFSVSYLPVRSAYSTRPGKYRTEKYTEFSKGVQAILPSRMISTNEYSEYYAIMETYGIKPEAMLMIVKYCADMKGTDIGCKYISKVAKDFGNRGVVTVEKVEKELSSYVLRTGEIQKILTALSLKRRPEIEDLTLFKKWTQEMNFESANIIFAAKKIKRGGMQKLDAFLAELYSNKSFSKEEIASYMAEKERVYDLAVRINKTLSVYAESLDAVIDNYTNKWLSYGFDDKTLIFIANKCFLAGNNTLRDMDALIEDLRVHGFIDLASVNDKFESEKKTDEFIKTMLLAAGVNRRPTPWDRENLSAWKSWNFSEDMILEAAARASGKSSPIAYMNGILSNWKNNGTFDKASLGVSSAGGESEYNREYERRRAAAVARAAENSEKAMGIDGFKEIYSRLNGLEKDLAFAEISGDTALYNSLEEEQKTLRSKAEKILSEINLSLRDLSPVYACEKCSDTGYVGTKRCDCFDKKV